MPDRDTDWKPKIGDQVLVDIVGISENDKPVIICSGFRVFMRAEDFHPLPAPSATAQRVVEAAVAHRRKYPNDRATGDDTYSKILAATDAHLASLRPADPLAVLIAAAEEVADARAVYALAAEREAKAEGGTPHRRAEEDLTEAKRRLNEAHARWRAAIPLIEAAIAKGEG